MDGRLPDPHTINLADSACDGYGPWPVEGYGNLVKVNHANQRFILLSPP